MSRLKEFIKEAQYQNAKVVRNVKKTPKKYLPAGTGRKRSKK
ncbi:hypothetical protein RU93_GL002237 [Enterococcus aquimarinus]|uniref:Uncharacterized protein n=1 Tax=Enterococcus aquimarinus TaxID=328396 RepID=A0A1L8QSF9_9ENTE|nr:hypothetical protein RU93_GL002237 [Enterococcus aquimarinus]